MCSERTGVTNKSLLKNTPNFFMWKPRILIGALAGLVFAFLSRELERHLPEGAEGGVVAPVMGIAWTDSRFFRERGAIAYGIAPFMLKPSAIDGLHGRDEHLPIAELDAGVRRIYRVLEDVASKDS